MARSVFTPARARRIDKSKELGLARSLFRRGDTKQDREDVPFLENTQSEAATDIFEDIKKRNAGDKEGMLKDLQSIFGEKARLSASAIIMRVNG